MSTKQWKRIRRFAIAYTIAAAILLIMSFVGTNQKNTVPLFAVCFLVALTDWVRVAMNKPSSKATSIEAYRTVAEKYRAPVYRTQEIKQQAQTIKPQTTVQVIQEEKVLREQSARELERCKDPEAYRAEKDAKNGLRRSRWLQKPREMLLLCYNATNRSADKWLLASGVDETLRINNYPVTDPVFSFSKEGDIWYIQAENGAEIRINGNMEKSISGNCCDVEILSGAYGSKIPVYPGDCFTVTKGAYKMSWYLSTTGHYPSTRW